MEPQDFARLRGPLEPAMPQDEFEALNGIKKVFLTCNVIGCKNVVSTHGMLCVYHTMIKFRSTRAMRQIKTRIVDSPPNVSLPINN